MELNKYGYSVKRQQDVQQAIFNELRDNFPYMEGLMLDETYGVRVHCKPLLTDYKSSFVIFVDESEPLKRSAFVPVHHTTQINIAVVRDEVLNKEHVLYPFMDSKLPCATGPINCLYNFGFYYDEGGTDTLKKIAIDVRTKLAGIVAEYFKHAENEVEEFKKSCTSFE